MAAGSGAAPRRAWLYMYRYPMTACWLEAYFCTRHVRAASAERVCRMQGQDAGDGGGGWLVGWLGIRRKRTFSLFAFARGGLRRVVLVRVMCYGYALYLQDSFIVLVRTLQTLCLCSSALVYSCNLDIPSTRDEIYLQPTNQHFSKRHHQSNNRIIIMRQSFSTAEHCQAQPTQSRLNSCSQSAATIRGHTLTEPCKLSGFFLV